MNLGEIAKRAATFTAENSPAILTAVGVTGALTTAYLTGRASFKAAEILQQEAEQRVKDFSGDTASAEPMTRDEKIELVWKLYIPAAATAGLTIGAIVAANRIGTRRTAALASAYALSEKAIAEYKAKVKEKLGEKKERAIRDEIAQDRITANPIHTREFIYTDSGATRCYDMRTDRYFNSDYESIRKAVNDINFQVNNDYYASLSDFYSLLGLRSTDESDDVGWNVDNKLDVTISTCLDEHNRPCLALSFDVKPIRGYHRLV